MCGRHWNPTEIKSFAIETENIFYLKSVFSKERVAKTLFLIGFKMKRLSIVMLLSHILSQNITPKLP
jgi:hypothetical protein